MRAGMPKIWATTGTIRVTARWIPIKTSQEISFDTLERVEIATDDGAAFTARCRFRAIVPVAGREVGFAFDDGAASAWLARNFRESATSVEPNASPGADVGKAARDATAAYFWHDLTDARVYRGALDARAVAALAEVGGINAFLRREGLLGFHAATIARGSTAIAVLGSSGAGKTTTTFAAARLGLDVYSDERCIVEGGIVHAFPRALTLRAGGAARLRAEDPLLAALPAGGPERDMRFFALAPARSARPRLRAIFALAGFAAEPLVEPVELHAILPEVMRSLVCRERDLDRLVRAMRELRDVAVFRLTLGAPFATARALAATMDRFEAVAVQA